MGTTVNATDLIGEDAYRNTQGRALIAGLVRVAQRLWGSKATENLADRANVSPRSVDTWEQGKGSLSASALANIIRSEEGWQFLETLMENHRPRWWRLVVPLMEVAEIQAMQLAARRRLRNVINGALDADKNLSAAMARADALLHHDPDFYGSHSDALRGAAGLSGRAVASPKPNR